MQRISERPRRRKRNAEREKRLQNEALERRHQHRELKAWLAKPSRHTWRDLVLSADGPIGAGARLAAIVLVKHMDSRTLETFVGAELVAEGAGVVERTIRTHLQDLEHQGWLSARCKGRGRDYALRIFAAQVPASIAKRVTEEFAVTQTRDVTATPAGVPANDGTSDGNSRRRVTEKSAPYPDSLSRIYPEMDPGALARASPSGSRDAAQQSEPLDRECVRRVQATVSGLAINKRVRR
jgi:hypothetical protein